MGLYLLIFVALLISAIMVRKVKWWRKYVSILNNVGATLVLLPVNTYYPIEVVLIGISGHIFQTRQYYTR